MSADIANFKAWYSDTLEVLYPRRESGIAVFMVSVPLLERYLRQKNSLAPSDKFTDACLRDLMRMFASLSSEQQARQFWNVFRNGFLHQATLSVQLKSGANLPTGWLSHDKQHAVTVEPDGSFWLHPVLFSQRVIQEIEQNFSVFVGSGTPAPPLPTVMDVGPPNPGTASHDVYRGTRGGL